MRRAPRVHPLRARSGQRAPWLLVQFFVVSTLVQCCCVTGISPTTPCPNLASPRLDLPLPGLPALRTIHVTPYRTFSQSDHPASPIPHSRQKVKVRRREAQIPRYKRTGGPLSGTYTTGSKRPEYPRTNRVTCSLHSLSALSRHAARVQTEFERSNGVAFELTN